MIVVFKGIARKSSEEDDEIVRKAEDLNIPLQQYKRSLRIDDDSEDKLVSVAIEFEDVIDYDCGLMEYNGIDVATTRFNSKDGTSYPPILCTENEAFRLFEKLGKNIVTLEEILKDENYTKENISTT